MRSIPRPTEPTIQTDKESVDIQHNSILVDKTGKTDPLFYVRKANSNLENTPTTKLLINKVILAWKHTLHNELEVSNYITSAFLWIGIKAQLDPITYNNIGRNFLILSQRFDPASVKSLWETAIKTYNEMYPNWTPCNNSMIPWVILRYINTVPTNTTHVTPTDLPTPYGNND
jgi:hypothetical protein